MNYEITKEEHYQSIPVNSTRLNPYVLTEMDKPKNLALFNKLLPNLKPYLLLEQIESPKKLFQFLFTHKNEFIIITEDIFSKRKNYTDIIEGAVCSSPDSSSLWKVQYLNEKSFEFKGKLILCSRKSKNEIHADPRFKNFKRDCIFI